MKNSASWLPISSVSGCYVRYRGGGAGVGAGGGNGWGRKLLWTAALSDQDDPRISQQQTFTSVRSHFSAALPDVHRGLRSLMDLCDGVAAYVTRERRRRRRDSSTNSEGRSDVGE